MFKVTIALAAAVIISACASNVETTRSSLIERAEILAAEADAGVTACVAPTGADYGRCIGAAYDAAMMKAGWPQVNSTPLSLQLAVVG
ncbi:MAG: hypothetical protein ACR2RE_10715, partial [Geminicoccaceae bacterium]